MGQIIYFLQYFKRLNAWCCNAGCANVRKTPLPNKSVTYQRASGSISAFLFSLLTKTFPECLKETKVKQIALSATCTSCKFHWPLKKISKQTFEIDKFKLQVDKRCM